jgi:flagellar biosynthesis protein FliQ
MNKKSWQRLTLSLIGIGVILATWQLAVFHLYALPVATIAAFTTITVNSLYVIGSIVIFMITGRLYYEWKMNTISNVAEEGKQTVQKIERTFAPKHFDDGTVD